MTARRWILILSLLTIVCVGAVVFLLLPFFADSEYLGPEHLKDFILSQIERNIGRKVEVRKVQLKVFPRLEVELSDVTIYDLDRTQVFLKAKQVEVILRLLPLLRRQVVGKRLFIEEPELAIRRDQQGLWNFLAVPQLDEPEDRSIGNPLRRVLLMRELTVKKGQLTLEDNFRPDGKRSVRFQELEIATLAEPRRKRADVAVSATVPGPSGTSSLMLSGRIQGTLPEPRIVQETSEGKIPTFQFEGLLEANNIQLAQAADFFGPRPVPKEVKGRANIRGRLRVVPGVVGYDMVLSEMAARVTPLTLTGQASLSGLLTAQPTFALTFTSSQITIKELQNLVPAQWFHPELPRIIAERNIRASVEVVTATLTGMAMPEPRLSLTGELRVHNGHAMIDQQGTVVENVSGTVLVEPGRIRVMELSGQYGTMQVAAGKAMISLLEAGPWMELELNGQMTAAELWADMDVTRTFKSLRLAKVWKSLRDIQGMSQVTFRLNGPLNKPNEIRYVGAEFSPQDVSFRSSLLSEPVVGLNGRLSVSDDGAQFDSLRGWVGQAQFHLQGRILGGDQHSFQDFTITTRAEAKNLFALLPFDSPPTRTPQGSIAAVIGLSGPVETPRFKGILDLSDSAMSLTRTIHKPRGRQASLEFDGTLSRRTVPFINRLELVLPSLRLSGTGSIRLDKRFRIKAALGVGPIPVTRLPDWMRPDNMETGDIEVSLDVRGKGTDWKTWNFMGWVALTNGAFSIKGIDSSVRDVNLRVKLIGNAAEVKYFGFRILDSDATITGVIRNWQRKPLATITAESSHFDIDLLIPKEGRSPIRDFLEDVAASSRVTAHATIERGTYKLLTFSNLSSRVNIINGVLDLDRVTAKSFAGAVDGRVVIRLPKGKPASTEAAVRITGLPFEDVYSLISDQESRLTGPLFLTGTLRGDGRHPRGVSATLNGNADFRIENGRIFKDDSRAIWKILSLLHVPALLQGKVDLEKDGLPFDQITSRLTVKGGRLSSENLALDSPVIKMTAAGTYDIPTDQLDYIVAVSPFGPYTSLLKSIPLFGQLIKGERQGLATALFKVKGSIRDPEVEYLPMRSFAGGLGGLAKLAVDILVNVVKFPQEMMAPENNEKPNLDRVPDLPRPNSP